LRRQYETARDFDDRKPCLGGSCSACGACQDASEVKLMTGHIIATPGVANFQARMTRLLEVKTAFKPVCISAFLPEELSRSCLAYRESWVSRSLSALVPGAEKLIFRVSEVAFNAGQAFGSMLQDGEGRFGVSLFVLFGPDENKSRSLLGMVAKAGARARVPESIKLFASSVQLLPEYLAPRRISASIDMPDPGLMPGMAQAVDRFLDHNKLACKKTRSVVGTGESIVYEFPESRMGRRFFFDATLGSGDSGVSFLFSAGDRAKLSPLLKILGETCGTIPAVCIRSLE
ncbi:MAG: hypothetical protein LLF89_00715, partial [Spirochaetaceae bacterium]|nr:hypothetical protein [Spirochaetaceae bacterium]